jgi:STE24 endopeptidase
MTLRKALVGFAMGLGAGYVVARTLEAAAEWRDPSTVQPRDAGAYARARRSLEVAGTVRGTLGALAFAFGPLGERIDAATSRLPPWLRPLFFITPLALTTALFELPVSYVEEYSLERRFELSDQTVSSWLADYAKSAVLASGLLAFVASLVGIAVRHAPRAWMWLASIGVFPLLVAGNIIVPLYVMPLFNAFAPVHGSLEDRLRRLAARFGVGNAAILRMNMSKQTRKANAFVTGIGRTHRIVLGDTLIEAFPENETEFVVAHELGHYVNRDTWRLIGVSEIVAIALFSIANSAISPARRRELRYRPLLLLRFYAVMLLAGQLLRPLMLAFSRSREWAADRFALAATCNPATGVAAFRRLREQNLADEDPPRWYELFFASHPSLRARIAALEASLD